MRLRRYGAAAFIAALLAVSGFAAAAIASSESLAGALQTTATTTLATTVVSTTTVTQTVTTTLPAKLTICHHARARGGATKHVTIRISPSAWPAHFRHGDTIGSCSTAKNKRIHSSKAHAKKFHKKGRKR